MSVTWRWALACLMVLSLSSCVLADIIIENEVSAPVDAITPPSHSAMPVLNRLSQRIQESDLKEKSLLSAKSAARAELSPAVNGAFADAIFGSVWSQAYKRCPDVTLTTTQTMLTTYWNWNGVGANQGYIHIFDYMNENDKRALLRLRELAVMLNAAIVPGGGANAELRAYGALLAELLLPFANFAAAAGVNYGAANTFVKPAHIMHDNFQFAAVLASLNAADGFLRARYTQGADPALWNARAEMVSKVNALNFLIQINRHNPPPAGPAHYCTVFVGVATVVTAALKELHRLAVAPAYSCTYETHTIVNAPPGANDVSEIVWVPSVANHHFHFAMNAPGVEIRLFNARLSTFIPKQYGQSLVAATNLEEIAMQNADANQADFITAVAAHAVAAPHPANLNGNAAGIAGFNLRGFRATLNAAGGGRARVVTAATARLTVGAPPAPAAVDAAVNAALTAKLHRCLP